MDALNQIKFSNYLLVGQRIDLAEERRIYKENSYTKRSGIGLREELSSER